MSKLKLGVIFGGMSTEHEVSIISGTSVIKNLDKEKYEVYPIYISKQGEWYHYIKPVDEIEIATLGEKLQPIKVISNIVEMLQQLDVAFPVLHGLGGEDGTIQGLLELLKIPYVGCHVLASSLGMDKAYTKVILEKAGLKQAPYCYIQKCAYDYVLIDSQFNEKKYSIDELCDQIIQQLSLPVFVKPSNSGSSVGVKKAKREEELKQAIIYASEFDYKILVEKNIDGLELECAVLGNREVTASGVGRILPAEQFYTYDAKYSNSNSKVEIPAAIPEEKASQIKQMAIKAFKAIDGSGLSRVDFFLEKDTGVIYINEINTLPGFTTISMYPKLWEEQGLSYRDLLDTLIALASKR